MPIRKADRPERFIGERANGEKDARVRKD